MSGSGVVPWLEDTPYRAWDRPFQVREQLRAAADHSNNEWLMWHPGSTYTPEVYLRVDRPPAHRAASRDQ